MRSPSDDHRDYARNILGERIEDHHDILTCPHCRASYDAKHLNRDGTCPSCERAVICPECHENTVAEGAERCTNCEDAEAVIEAERIARNPGETDAQYRARVREWMEGGR